MTLPLLDLGPSIKPPSKRRERDAYYTPDWGTEELLKAYPNLGGCILLDPCAGDGRMLRKLGPRFQYAMGNDIAPIDPKHYALDARSPELYQTARPCSIVSNLPFCYAGEIAWQCVRPDHAVRFVALLLRCTFLEPCAGREWLTRHPPRAIISMSRLSFTDDGSTDSAPAWWFIWGDVEPGIRVVTGKEQPELSL